MRRHDLPGLPDLPDDPRGAERWQRYIARTELATLTHARKRVGAIALLATVVLCAIGGRTAYWQLTQGQTLGQRANAEDLRRFPISTGRGVIYDANGTVLAVSVTEEAVIADPDMLRQMGELDLAARTLSTSLNLPVSLLLEELDVTGSYARIRGADGTTMLLTQAQAALVNAAISKAQLDGLVLLPQVQRIYPSGQLAAQVLGFVRASDGTGQYGVEQQANTLLNGTPGWLYTAVDAQGDPLATGPHRETAGTPGANVTLTIDANVQFWAEQGLAEAVAQTGADGGTVVALDPKTGAIIAMANDPSFDPNSYGNAPLADLTDPAVSAQYDPGSVMKAMTMAAGIDSGAITPNSALYDPGYTDVDGIRLYNFNEQAHGTENMTQVLQYSANVGAVWVAQRIGQQKFESYLRAFGFGSRTGVDLPNEAAGAFATAASAGDGQLNSAENAFGESIGVTALQMASAYGALANGGVLMRPYVIASTTSQGGSGSTTKTQPVTVRRVVSTRTASEVTQMLVNSAKVSEAEMSRVAGYSVAAKTGTATPNPNDPSLTYASVAGYAPANNPRFVLLVMLRHPRTTIFGGEAAGPLWRSLAEQMLHYYGIRASSAAG